MPVPGQPIAARHAAFASTRRLLLQLSPCGHHCAAGALKLLAESRSPREFLADVGVAVTGVAGPGGGTPEKPVGRVHLHVSGPGGGAELELTIPGDREAVRARATVTALHLLRRVLAQR